MASQLFNAEKKSHLYETYALFAEEGQTQFLYQGSNHFWGAIGSRIILFDLDSFWGHPQFILNAGVQASLRKQKAEFLSDTLDVRVGLAALFAIDSTTRLKVTIAHLSGHVLEDVPDLDLTPKNVGDESIQFRLIKDYADKVRLGGSLKYLLGTASAIKKLSADQFIEWFPVGEQAQSQTPFLATGMEESGIDKYLISTHMQGGVYWGNHLNPLHHEVLKLSGGWYRGLDPRQKYSHYKKSKASFGYFGLSYEY
jgi:hypothetical protein